jgi:hypothetical protein
MFANTDANFKLQRGDRNQGEGKALCDGYGYVVKEREYKEYLEKNKDVKQEVKLLQFTQFRRVNQAMQRSTCVSHDAVNNADTRETRGLSITGVGTVDCARHDMKRPVAMVPLTGGERLVWSTDLQPSSQFCSYVNMDYANYMSWRNTLLLWIVLSYDIMCQYWVNFWTRMTTHFDDKSGRLYSGDVHFTPLIPKFHLPAHIKRCWEKFNFNFAKWTGHTDGEGVERGWSLLNRLKRSLKEMGPGAWRDTLEDHIGDSNWKKIGGFGECRFAAGFH